MSADAGTEATPPDAAAVQGEAGDAADEVAADFDPKVWEPAEKRYGMVKLLGILQAMLPIEKPAEIAKLKFLFFPGYGVQEDEPEEKEKKSNRRPVHNHGEGKERNDQRGKGNRKGAKGREDQRTEGRFVPEMGKTELEPNYVKNQWWRNSSKGELEVIVRDGFSLMSQEIWKVPFGHYVQQSGPSEIFVSGQAAGLCRMPVYPSGWVTADASSVGGPKYLEAARVARWKVNFKSDTPKGDILVRGSVSLESDEVGCISYGTLVHQNGPQKTLEDGIIRMPITWAISEPSSGSGGTRSGWVTCDASSQGGPKFFLAAPEEDDPNELPVPPPPADDTRPASGSRSTPAGAPSPEKAKGADGISTWDKNRLWKVTGLEPGADPPRMLPIVTRSEPYAPGTGRVPAEDSLVRWLENDEVVEQIGHSKKTRGYMVMPIRVVRDAKGEEVKNADEGWVTRRLVDKTYGSDGAWLVEMREGGEDAERDKRRAARDEKRRDNRG